MEKYGQNLTRSIVEIDLGGGKTMNFKFCLATYSIYGLKRFMQKYRIRCNYMLFFTYMGSWKFALTVYDTQCWNHFRDDDGVLYLHEFDEESGQLDLSSISGSLIEGFCNLLLYKIALFS